MTFTVEDMTETMEFPPIESGENNLYSVSKTFSECRHIKIIEEETGHLKAYGTELLKTPGLKYTVYNFQDRIVLQCAVDDQHLQDLFDIINA